MASSKLYYVIICSAWAMCRCIITRQIPNNYDPEIYMNASEMIAYNGYPVENHDIYTSDGFILRTQRIPHGKNRSFYSTNVDRPVVLLQHGLNSGSDCYVMESNASLGFILADAGFDVWLSNSRGNLYGRRNTHLNSSQEKFWDWSFDEMASFDIPAVIDYILKTTNHSKLVYIGLSQGTNIAFAAFSQNKSLADKVKLFIAMAPIAQVTHIKGLLRWLADIFGDNSDNFFKIFGRKDFMSNSSLAIEYSTRVCEKEPVICVGVADLMTGFDFRETNLTRISRYTAHGFEGTSVKNMVHYIQEIRSGKYQKYDYGSTENQRRYNQTTPPLYDLTKIQIPTAIFYAGRDWLADPQDVMFVEKHLRSTVHVAYFNPWNHLDFILAKSAPFSLFPDIISLIRRYHTSMA